MQFALPSMSLLCPQLFQNVYHGVVDQKPKWKDDHFQRYSHAVVQSVEGVSEKVDALISQHLHNQESNSSIDCYFAFHRAFRSQIIDSFDGEEECSKLHRACMQWFTGVNHVGSLEETLFKLIEGVFNVNPQLKHFEEIFNGESLHDKLNVTYEAINLIPSELLGPALWLNTLKMYKSTSLWDPYSWMNMIWQFNKTYYLQASAIKEVANLRTCAPVAPAIGYRGEVSSGKTSIAPEFLAMIKGLQHEGKRAIIFCHLNAKCLRATANKKEVSYEPSYASYNPFHQNEGIWSSLEMKLSTLFPETVSVCLFPYDGAWMKLAFDESKKNCAEYINFLLEEVIMAPQSLFVFDHKLLYTRDERDMMARLLQQKEEGCVDCQEQLLELVSRPEKFFQLKENRELDALKETAIYKFVKSALDDVGSNYFQFIETFSVQHKQAFYGIFIGHLQEMCQQSLSCDVEIVHCTDGVDRTAASMTAKNAIGLMRDGTYFKKDLQKKFIAHVLGPALAIWDRAVLKHRLEIPLAILQHLELMYSQQIQVPLPDNWHHIEMS